MKITANTLIIIIKSNNEFKLSALYILNLKSIWVYSINY